VIVTIDDVRSTRRVQISQTNAARGEVKRSFAFFSPPPRRPSFSFFPVETIPHLTDRMDPPQSGRKPCGSNGSDATPSIDVCNVTTNGSDGKGLWQADAKFKLSLNSSNQCHSMAIKTKSSISWSVHSSDLIHSNPAGCRPMTRTNEQVADFDSIKIQRLVNDYIPRLMDVMQDV
jgi:hypothetical protein